MKTRAEDLEWGTAFPDQARRLVEQDFVLRVPKIPVMVPRFNSGSLPDASRYVGTLIYCPDTTDFKGSDGASWVSLSGGGGGGSGTVTSVATGAGLTGGTITVAGTISLASIADQRVLANFSGGSAAPVATAASSLVGVGSALQWTNTRTITLGSDATGSVGVNGSADVTLNLTIANNAVTYAKMQDVSAASRLIGRGAGSGSGDPQELSLGAGLEMTGTTVRAGVSGVAVVDFGSAGSSDAVVAVADTSVATGSVILASILARDTVDHTADEHLAEEIVVMAGGITAGVGFNIYARTGNVALRGSWNVAYHRMS